MAVAYRRVRGVGQVITVGGQALAPTESAVTPLLRAYCDSTIGQGISPSYCKIPSQADLSAAYAKELATTQLTPANQQAAIDAANAALAADQAAHPSDYALQDVASNNPSCIAMFGTGPLAVFVCQNAMILGLFAGGLFLFNFIGGRR